MCAHGVCEFHVVVLRNNKGYTDLQLQREQLWEVRDQMTPLMKELSRLSENASNEFNMMLKAKPLELLGPDGSFVEEQQKVLKWLVLGP